MEKVKVYYVGYNYKNRKVTSSESMLDPNDGYHMDTAFYNGFQVNSYSTKSLDDALENAIKIAVQVEIECYNATNTLRESRKKSTVYEINYHLDTKEIVKTQYETQDRNFGIRNYNNIDLDAKNIYACSLVSYEDAMSMVLDQLDSAAQLFNDARPDILKEVAV